MIKNFKLILSIIALISYHVSGQISKPGKPKQLSQTLQNLSVIKKITINAFDPTDWIEHDKEFPSPMRYGKVNKLDAEFRDISTLTITSDGKIWQSIIESKGAYSLGVNFSKFYIPAGAELFLYNSERSVIYGAFTSQNNNIDSSLTIEDFKGDNLIIEYFEPTHVEFKGLLEIGSVVHAYRDIFQKGLLKSIEADPDYLPGINCKEGDQWQDVKHAVCRITFNDAVAAYLCTGSLINTTRSDGTPYFLTAAHCLSSQVIANTVKAYFDYEEEYCDGPETSWKTISGANLIASNTESDFTLIEFYTAPPANYQPYYAGWNAYDSIMSGGAGIHHPGGDPKKISLSEQNIESNAESLFWDIGDVTPPNTHWIVNWDIGYTLGGSSGSPLFDKQKRIMGQLHGGKDSQDYYGKIYHSWDKGSLQNEHQLKHWLDPDNTGAKSMTGYAPLIPPEANFYTQTISACTNEPVHLYDLSEFGPTQWTWEIIPSSLVNFTEGTSAISQNPVVIFTDEGDFNITLTAQNTYGSDTKFKPEYIGARSVITPIMVNITSDTLLCGRDVVDFVIKAQGAETYEFSFLSNKDQFDIIEETDQIMISIKPEYLTESLISTELQLTGSHGSCSATITRKIDIYNAYNDNIEDAVELVNGNNGIFSNYCATVQGGEPFPFATGCNTTDGWCDESFYRNGPITNTLWFKFIGPESGKVTISTPGFNNQIAVYQSESITNLMLGSYTIIAANDDKDYWDKNAYLGDISVDQGKQYWVQLDGGAGGNEGLAEVLFFTYEMDIFPNPSDGKINLRLSAPVENQGIVEVFSLEGKKVFSASVPSSTNLTNMPLKIDPVSSGLFLIIVRADGKVYSKKILIEKGN